MNKRINQRGFSRENNDDQNQYDNMSHGGTQQQYHGYTSHLSNPGMNNMPAVGGNKMYKK